MATYYLAFSLAEIGLGNGKLVTQIIELTGFLFRSVNDFLGKNGPQLAAAVSYYALFSLFPLTLAVIFGLSFFLGPESIEDLAQKVAQQAPISRQTVSDVLTGTLQSRNLAGSAGIVGLLAAGTAVFAAIRKGVNATWGITKPRPFVQERLIDISLMLAAAILMLVSIFSTAVLAYLREIVGFITTGSSLNGDFVWNRVASVIPPALSFIVFSGIYWLLPNTRVRFSEVLPGAIFATIAFEVIKIVFVWYVGNYSIYSTVYGSVGGVVALLTWVYLSALILLFGSLITYRHSARRARNRRR